MGIYNPLLHHCGELPPYSSVRAHHLVPAFLQVRNEARSTIQAILISQRELPTWDDFVVPLDVLGARMAWYVGTLLALSRSRSGDKWNKAFLRCSRIEVQFDQLLWGNAQLHALYRKLATSAQARHFSRPRQVLLERVLQRYRLMGQELSVEQRQRFRELGETIDELRQRFLSNVAAASRCASWQIGVEEEALLDGVSAHDKAAMARYRDKTLLGWQVDMSDPELVRTIMTDARASALREKLYQRRGALASDQGLPDCKTFDNSVVLEQLLRLRLEQARMLGFGSSAELALQRLSVRDTSRVLWFLHQQIANKAPDWITQRAELVALAPDSAVKPWDYSFYGQQVRLNGGALGEDEFRSHFRLERVLEKMLDLPTRLFGIEFVERQEVDTWHASIRTFEVREGGQTLGYLFLDLFNRAEKLFKSASTFSLGHRLLSVEGREVKVPVAVLSCALPANGTDEPVLLKHGQLRTLFHEFGHCLHQLLDPSETWQLSCIEHSGLDVREFFSRLMERWSYSVDFLVDMSRHHQTGASLSADQARRLRIFLESQAWLHDSAQLMYSGADFFLHLLQPVDAEHIRLLMKENLAHWPRPMHERFIYSFTHLVTGYEARYFTYLWGLELATEVFARFEEKGLFDAVEGRRLRAELFAPAATRALTDSVAAFLGRPAKAAMRDSSDPAFVDLMKRLAKVQSGETDDRDSGTGSDPAQPVQPRSVPAWAAMMFGSALKTPRASAAPAPNSVGVGRS
ncbi:M3 family metallopeptidase [Pseudomonas vanderleydeniana]|uniref:Oligopeptidase A n=1 Tax=Pseudomonas vanderleydeniana TaxID=2745495 RepID=A0A9E6PKT8_9PSED|nr:M3 family metallopeptidase [Pseudomonas vanderleydeniana]QXI28627.1 oligopeptidase A [Pseudomonas vanderleydeniana]